MTSRPMGFSPDRSKGFALPAINSKEPVQLTRDGRQIEKTDRNRNPIENKSTAVVKLPNIAKDLVPKHKTRGNAGSVSYPLDQSNVPLYQNDQSRAGIDNHANGGLESANIDMKTPVGLGSWSPKGLPDVSSNRKGNVRTGHVDTNILKNRALYPSFNTHIDPEASERHFHSFGL